MVVISIPTRFTDATIVVAVLIKQNVCTNITRQLILTKTRP